ncbi:MAG TPA: Rab family GTPase [Candidatus Lokiarchaeia archaeon]|nr:Rab family GTPase [Candidatus Lokiarchaeia archaeon]
MKKLKIVLVGSNAVGKTSIANRFTRNLFANRYINTIGCDFYIKNLIMETSEGSEEYKLILHDIGGQLEFREFRRKYMDNADIVLVVVALNDPGTSDVDEFIEDIYALPSKPIFAIVGNKLDLVEKDSLDTTGIDAVAEKYNVPVYLTSAKENIMIQEMFMDMVKKKIETP